VLHINSGATLDFQYSATPANTMTFASGSCLANRVGTLTVSTANVTFPTSGTMIFNQDDVVGTNITVNGAYPALTGPLTLQIGGMNPTVGTVTLSGAISGSGGLTKTSTGALILSSANSYTGGTTVSGGTLDAHVSGSLSSGNVAVASGAMLTLESTTSMATTADLLLNGSAAGMVTNSFSGSQKIGALSFDGGTTVQASGTWGSTSSTATHKDSRFTGSGLLNNSIAITVTAVANSKTYDGATSAAATPTLTGSLASGDTATLTETYDTKNTGTGKTLTPTAIIKDSGNNVVTANYTITYVTSTAGAISAAPLAYVANPASRNYGSANPAFSGTVNGFVGSDTQANATTGTLGFTSSATLSSNVGSYAINGSGLTANNGNYTFGQAAGNATALTIGKAALSVTANADSKTYGLTRSYGAGSTAFTSSGLKNGETIATVTLAVSGNGDAATAPVSGSPYAITPSAATGGTFTAGNYTITYVNGALTVTPATLTVTADNKSKAYGTVNPALTASYSGFLNGDDPSVVTGAASITTTATTTSPAGSYPITASQGSLSAANYSFAFVAGSLTVGQVTLTVQVDDQSRAYGATNPVFTVTYTGFLNGDDTNVLSGVPAFSTTADTNSPVAGSPYAVSATNGTLSATSYNFAFVDGQLTVTQAVLTVSADMSMVYGGPVPELTASYSGFVNGEDTNVLSGAPDLSTAATATSTVAGSPYTIIVTNGTLSASNYMFAFVNGALSVTPASVTGSITAGDKVYDGGTAAIITGWSLSGAVGSDDVSLSGGTASFDNKNAGTGKTVTASGLSLSGADMGNYVLSTNLVTTTANITAAGLVVSATGQSKVYDGTTTTAVSLSDNRISGDVLSDSYASANFADKNAGTGKSITVNGISISGTDSGNYLFNTSASASADITPATLTVSADNKSKTYGAGNPALTASYSGFAPGDDSSVVTGSPVLSTSATESSGAGSYPITASQGSLSAANYTFAFVPGSLTVGQATLTVQADDQSRGYGQTNPVFTASYSGFVNNDTSSALSGNPDFSTGADTNSAVDGSPYPINVSAGTLSTANYSFAFVDGQLTVTQAVLTVSADSLSKLYGMTNPVLTASYSGFVNGEDTNVLSGAPDLSTTAVDGSAVASYPITVSLGSLTATNYSFEFTNGTLTVALASLTPQITASDKVYDGTSVATLASQTLAGVIGSDDVSLTVGSASFDDKNVGNGKTVTASGLALSGGAAANYILGSSTATTTANITPATLHVSATGQDKVYDGTATATVSLSDDRLAGDAFTASYSAATFSDQNAGAAKTVSVSGISLSGADAGNYTFDSTASATANIAPLPITVSAADNSKTYDGTTSAAASPTITTGALQGGDTAGFSETYDTRDMGNGKTLTPSGSVSDGNGGNNYTVTYAADNNGSILPATLTVTATAANKSYDGTTAASVTLSDNRVSGDALTDSYTSASFDDKNAGTGKNVSVSGISISGADAGNYVLANTVASASADISPVGLTITAQDASTTYGQAVTFSGSEFTASGLLSGDTVSSVNLSSTGAGAGAGAGTYDIIASSAAGIGLGNYSIAYHNGTLTVGPAGLTVTANDQSRGYGATNEVFTAGYNGLVNGDGSGVLNGTLSFSCQDTNGVNVDTNTPVGTYPIVASGQSAANYTLTYVSGTLTVTQAVLTVSADSLSKLYGMTNPVLTASYSGFVNGEDTNVLSGAPDLSTTAVDGSAVASYPITVSLGSLTATNYSFEFTNGTLTVALASLTPQITASDKVYDGTSVATLASQTLAGVIGSDDVSLTVGSASFDDKNVGNGKTVTASGLALSGGAAANYILGSSTATTTANITPATLHVSATAQDKVYDGTATATVSLSDDRLAGDAFTASYSTATFSDQNAGTAKTVSVSGISLSGADAGNYTFDSTASATANIAPLPITVSAADNSKTYDGTTSAAASPTITTGALQGGDTAGFSEAYDTRDMGNGKTLTPSGSVSDGNGGNNYTVTYAADNNGIIQPATLTVTATAANKSYDGTTAASVTLSDNRVSGDALTDSYTSASFDDKNAGTGKNVSVSGISISGADAGNYVLANTVASASADISPVGLTITAQDASTTYGQAVTFSGSEFTASGLLSGDTVSSVNLSSTGAGAGAGAGTYDIIASSAAGIGLGNYSIAYHNGTLTVGPAGLTVTANDQSRGYGATNEVFTAGYNGLVNGDGSGVLNGTLSFSCQDTNGVNVDTNTPVGTYPIVASGQSAANYTLTYVSGTLTVTQAVLTVSADSLSKLYGMTNPVLTASYSGFVNGEDTNVLSGAPDLSTTAVDGSAVASYPITVSLGSLTATNYSFEFTNGTLTVALASLTPQITASDKVYDGTSVATLASQTLAGVIGSDDVSLTVGSASFDDKNAGNGKTVTASGLALSGGAAANYILGSSTATTTANITPATLHVSATAQDKAYDGTSTATVSLSDDRLAGDAFTASYSAATFSDQNAGTAKTVSVSGISLSGADAGNYTFDSTASATANIAPLAITVSAADNSKTYDGTTSAAASPTITTGAVQGGDTAGFSETYDTRDMGNGKTLTPSGSVSDGNGGNNYTVTYAADNNGSILPATLTVTATAANKSYDGTTAASVTLSDNRVSGDALTDSYTSASFDDKNAGTGKNVSVSGISISGADAGNYVLANTVASASADISPVGLTITAQDASTTYGQAVTFSGSEFTASGLLSGDTVSSVNLSSTGAGAGAGAGTYDIIASSAAGIGLGNYSIAYHNGTLTVGPAGLTVTANDQSRGYGATNEVFTAGYNGLVNGDGSGVLNGTLSFSCQDTNGVNVDTNTPVGTYPIVASGQSAANYTLTYVSGTLTVTQAVLTVSADSLSKLYGMTNPVLTASYSGFVNGEDTNVLSGAPDLSTTAVDGSAVASYPITVSLGSLTATNYSFEFTNGTLTVALASLTPQITASDKVYDGTSVATLASQTLAGVIGSDDVSLTVGSASFDDKNAGNGKTVTASGLALSGGAAANYILGSSTATTTANITPATLHVSATGQDKVYDGTATATVSLSDDRLAGDQLDTSDASASFGDKHVGTGKTVTVSGISVSGTDAGNYTVNGTATANADITARALSVSAVTDSKTYDGTAGSSATPLITGSVAPGDSANFAQSFDDKNAGTGKTLTASGAVNDGNSGNDYAVTFSSVNTGAINPANLTVTADNKTRPYGVANPVLTASYSGFVGGDTQSVLAGSPDLGTAATQTSVAGTYPITASLDTLSALNYTFSFVDGTLTVFAVPQLSTVGVSANGFVFNFPTVAGQQYQVEYSDNLGSGTWTPLGQPIAGTGSSVNVTNTISVPQRFFRLNCGL
jgi:autotransporter-associated beta strand protein